MLTDVNIQIKNRQVHTESLENKIRIYEEKIEEMNNIDKEMIIKWDKDMKKLLDRVGIL